VAAEADDALELEALEKKLGLQDAATATATVVDEQQLAVTVPVPAQAQAQLALAPAPPVADATGLRGQHNVFGSRVGFRTTCQRNQYVFDELRRAKWASMMLLHFLHYPDEQALGQEAWRRRA